MVISSLFGSTLLRTQQTHLPQTFRRYKSLTAAIERGKQGGPDRPFRPRTRPPPEDFEGARPQPRFERRAEQFGPSKTEDREKSRSSRFGRIGPPRSRDGNAPSRFEDERSPWRREDGAVASSEGPMSGKRFDGERRPSSDRWEGRSKPASRSDDRPPRQDQGGFGQRDERPPWREGQFESRDKRPFNRDNREKRSFDRDNREKRSFDRDNREKRSFDRDSNFKGQETFSDRNTARGPPRESFGRRETGDRPDRPERPERSWTPRNETSSFMRGRFDGDRSEGYQRRDASRTQADAPTPTTRPTVTSENTVRVPEVLPYSTAASEFLYGHSSVVAALKANRRKLYKLYVHTRGSSRDGLMARVRALKLFHITEEVGDEYLRAMDKASSGRPHNGLVLESSPLPVPPITELKAVSISDETFGVTVDSQSAEDVLVNGKQETYSYKSAGWRQPLILYVDGVLDEGNLGAIARSAYFLGVDAVVTPTRQTAPWSHIAVKASAGAAEAVPLFKVGEPADFLGKSSRAGWRIYASDAIPPPPVTSGEKEEPSSKIVYSVARSTKRLPSDHCPVAEHPTILMMGAEGTGLRDSLLNLAHYKVGIKHGREVDEIGVDSLNVSVAASILSYEMLQKPIAKAASTPEEVLF
ncbi:hypothetical protein HBI56_099430 [Parastagonospora nodorum]|nr:hypothetical protein HBH51_084010 [Parastagonospora nodorum]KAH4006277.1 hypothetical protein HBI10_024650 [Parastagonospora nodorum]KAH4022936.1 hypothetical protein HBI13_092260 [Parastagonospora nodorum]KAH4108952.1 hypothetical protein HBH46_037480 [Parastagonospora nodorum]KAH4175870.1 hypothetical protein HBH43_068070 [Parastagonospora nodorum]